MGGSLAHTWPQEGMLEVGADPGMPREVPEGGLGRQTPQETRRPALEKVSKPEDECSGQSLAQGGRAEAWLGAPELRGWHRWVPPQLDSSSSWRLYSLFFFFIEEVPRTSATRVLVPTMSHSHCPPLQETLQH